MGESAVLLRSFSHPSDASREAKEGDPIHALTESISFGRFVSESLAWEKWSTFSHNRYLEEVEKFSKPGSVAEKKAYFEAHYKRKAAMKAAAIEEAKSAANDAPDLKTTGEIHNDSSTDTESVEANSHLVIDKQQEQYISNTDNGSSTDLELAKKNGHVVSDKQCEKNLPDTEVANSLDANACNSINVNNEVENADSKGAAPVIECAVNVEKPIQADSLKQIQNADFLNEIVASPVENMLNKEAVDQENLASSSKKKRSSCSAKSSTQSGESGLASYPSKQARSLPPRNVNNVAQKSVGDSHEKKRVVPKTLHMSINFTSHASETSKGSPKIPKDSSTPIRNPIRASVNGVSKHLSKIFQSEDRRNKALLSKSVSGGMAEFGKLHSLPTDGSESAKINGSKVQSPNISSPFSFRSEERAFYQKLEQKSKAKEAEKAQLKTRSKEKTEHGIIKLRQSTGFGAKKNELLNCRPNFQSNQAKKGKAEHDAEKLRQSTDFKAKLNGDLRCGSPSPSNQMKKIPLTQPWSPKRGGKPTPTAVQDASSRPPRMPSISKESSKLVREQNYRSTTRPVTSLPKFARKQTADTVQDASNRPPWRSSISTASFKRVMEKNNQSTTLSVTSLPKKNAHENASPNIQC
ncbi:hypothetical protein Patl1_16837 [Pistacia atlantica]|uniref:Uncharacterized protein n=1 Tax=Pistacia atlantica TaxID=434234 RepID=A0ACC1B7U0_9ROSI|nr:hypothetical protein Patl1_16837 [Pistacia atlantica]